MMDKTGDADALLGFHLYCPTNTKKTKMSAADLQLHYNNCTFLLNTVYLSRSSMGVNHSKFLYLFIDVSQSFKILLCKEKEENE